MATLNEQLTELQTTRDNMKVALEDKGQIVTNDIRTYAEAISNMSSGGIKLFETEEEMQADETAEEGDLAVVYRSEMQNMTEASVITTMTFPETIVLSSAVTSSSYAYLYDEDQSYETQCQIRLSSTYFYIRDYYTYEYICRYTSSDGITYTLNSGYETSYTFEQSMYFSGTWNDVYSEFIQCGGYTFEGLYTGKSIIKQIQPIKMSNMTINTETSLPNISDVITLSYDVDSFAEKVYPMVKYIDTLEGMTSHARHPYCIYLKDDNTISIVADGSKSSSVMLACPVFIDNAFKGLVAASYNVTNFYEWQFNLTTGEYIGRNDVVATDYTTFGTSTNNYYYTTAFNDYYYIGNMDWTNSDFTYVYSLFYNNTSYSANELAMTGITGIVYFLAPTQLSLSDSNELLPGETAYGPNGVIEGDGSVYNNLDMTTLLQRLLDTTDLQPINVIPNLSSGLTNITEADSAKIRKFDIVDVDSADACIGYNRVLYTPNFNVGSNRNVSYSEGNIILHTYNYGTDYLKIFIIRSDGEQVYTSSFNISGSDFTGIRKVYYIDDTYYAQDFNYKNYKLTSNTTWEYTGSAALSSTYDYNYRFDFDYFGGRVIHTYGSSTSHTTRTIDLTTGTATTLLSGTYGHPTPFKIDDKLSLSYFTNSSDALRVIEYDKDFNKLLDKTYTLSSSSTQSPTSATSPYSFEYNGERYMVHSSSLYKITGTTYSYVGAVEGFTESYYILGDYVCDYNTPIRYSLSCLLDGTSISLYNTGFIGGTSNEIHNQKHALCTRAGYASGEIITYSCDVAYASKVNSSSDANFTLIIDDLESNVLNGYMINKNVYTDTISPTEYNIAVETASEILNEEV